MECSSLQCRPCRCARFVGAQGTAHPLPCSVLGVADVQFGRCSLPHVGTLLIPSPSPSLTRSNVKQFRFPLLESSVLARTRFVETQQLWRSSSELPAYLLHQHPGLFPLSLACPLQQGAQPAFPPAFVL